jgi:hypothetical protein
MALLKWEQFQALMAGQGYQMQPMVMCATDPVTNEIYVLQVNPTTGELPVSGGGTSVQEVYVYPAIANFPLAGTANTLYVAEDTTLIYYWNSSSYVQLSPSGGGSQEVFFYADLASFPASGVTEKLYLALDTELLYRWDTVGLAYEQVGGGGSGTPEIYEYVDLAGFPASGVVATIYVAKDTNKIYRWTGTVYQELVPIPAQTQYVIESADFASLPATGTAERIYVTLDENRTWRWDTGTTAYVEIAQVKAVDSVATPASTNVGQIRYRVSGTVSYVDMIMQTGVATYAWVNILENAW